MSLPLLVFFAALGAVVGSFAGVVAERMHTGESWVRGRSRCNSCAEELRPVDLVPVLSWMTSLGRCRFCKAKVPSLYTVTEGVLGFLFALAYVKIGLELSLLFFLAALSVLAVIVLYDLRHTIVPGSASLSLLMVSLGYLLTSASSMNDVGVACIMAGLIALAFFALYFFSGGRAMGLGDAPIALALSVLIAPHAVSGLLFSFWIGAIVGIAILVTRPKGHRMGIEVPFVPFMAAGFLLAFFTQWNPLGLVIGY